MTRCRAMPFSAYREEADQEIVVESGSELATIEAVLATFRAQRLSKFVELGILEPAFYPFSASTRPAR